MIARHVPLLCLGLLLLAVPVSHAAAQQSNGYGTVSGHVQEASTGAPLVGAHVLLTERSIGTLVAADGSFSIPSVPAGTHSLRISMIGFRTEHRTVRVAAGVTDLGVIVLRSQAINLAEVVVTPGTFSIMGTQVASRQTLTEADIKNMSWAEDITRVVTRLPGISSSDFSSKFTIRGGEADEVLITLDGMELYEPFHQRDKAGGLFSIVDVESIRGVDLLTGGFPAAHGNRMSGAFNMTTKDPRTGPRQTTIGLSPMNARIYAQGTFAAGKGGYLASARRGMLDLTFKLVPDAEIVPSFHDALLKVDYRLNGRHKVAFHMLEAGDRATIDDADELGNFDRNRTRYRNLYSWGSLESVFSPALFARTLVYGGLVDHDRMGSFHKYEPSDKGDFFLRDQRDYRFVGLKQDWSWLASEGLSINAGFEAKRVSGRYDYRIDMEELRVTANGQPYDYARHEDIQLTPSGVQAAAYAASRIKLGERVVVEPSIRFDHTSYSGDGLVSPRIGLAVALAKQTWLRAATGYYYQSQFVNGLDVNNGQLDFNPAQLAIHYVIGLEHTTAAGLTMRLEAYQKELSRLGSNWQTLRDHQEMFPEQRNDNAQVVLGGGRSRGIETFLKYDTGGKISWWFSYALANAQDNVTEIVFDGVLDKRTGWVPRLNDQRHTIYADLNYRPGPKWTFNFSFVYYKGWPRTDYTFDYLTLPGGDLHFYHLEKEFNGTLYPAFHRLDVRANRRFQTRRGDVSTFLHVVNVYNRENLRKFDLDTRNDDDEYSLDAQGNYVPFEDSIYWFGLMPVFGVSWTF